MKPNESKIRVASPERLLSMDAVCRMTSRSRSSIYRDIERGDFPEPLKIGRRTIAWPLSVIQEWIRNLPLRSEARV